MRTKTARRTADDYRAAGELSPHNIEWAGVEAPPNVKTGTPWRCLDCGHEWLARYNNVVSSASGCPPCGYRRGGEKQRKPRPPRRPGQRNRAEIAADMAAGVKRCAKCQEVKALDAFHRSVREVDGRVDVCKACRHVPRVYPPLSTTYRCGCCGLAKPRSDFYAKRSSRNGHSGWCKACDRLRACVRFHNRRAMLIKSAGRVTGRQLAARWDYYGGLCWICGCEADQVDHVISLDRGGTNHPANLRPACAACNRRKWGADWRGVVVTRPRLDPTRLP